MRRLPFVAVLGALVVLAGLMLPEPTEGNNTVGKMLGKRVDDPPPPAQPPPVLPPNPPKLKLYRCPADGEIWPPPPPPGNIVVDLVYLLGDLLNWIFSPQKLQNLQKSLPGENPWRWGPDGCLWVEGVELNIWWIYDPVQELWFVYDVVTDATYVMLPVPQGRYWMQSTAAQDE